MKVQILIPAHCHHEVLFLTIGSWLETWDQSYSAEIHVGLHSTYDSLHPEGMKILLDKDHLNLHFVNEIDWEAHEGDNYRYSKMHAKNILNLMHQTKHLDFTHAALFDNDLIFHQDFISTCLQIHPKADLVGSLFRNESKPKKVWTLDDETVIFMPKVSVYHLLMSRYLFESAISLPESIKPLISHSPHYDKTVVYDTFAVAYELAQTQNMKVKILTTDQIDKMVTHLSSMSFNFGWKEAGNKAYTNKVNLAKDEYHKRFPDGIDHLLAKLA